MLAGMAFRLYASSFGPVFYLRCLRFTLAETAIEVGPDRYDPHPSYTGALITLVGLGLALGNWAGILALLSCMGAAVQAGYPLRKPRSSQL